MQQRMRIGDFLLRRLAEIGTTHMFGVPGDYNMSFLDQLESLSDITWIGTCNELNGAYAADGHARSGRPGVLLTTYGVGCLSAINGVAGAYCEQVPLIHISGAPPAHAVHDRVSLHHSLLDGGYRNIHRAFTEFTEYAATISASNAVDVIDHALITALRTRRPVRLELPSDLTHVEIEAPTDPLTLDAALPGGVALADAIAAVAEALSRAKRPTLLFDLPAVRFGAVEAIQTFCAALDIPFGCTVPAVHQLEKDSSQFLGILPSNSEERQKILAESDIVITCGLNLSDVTTGGFALDLTNKTVIRLLPTYAQLPVAGRTDPAVYYGAGLSDVLAGVLSAVAPEFSTRTRWWTPPEAFEVAPANPAGEVITEEYFFSRVQDLLRVDDVLIAETGTAGQNTVGLNLPVPVRYINQSSWGSIGYALPALLGAFAASPDRRHVLCVGDGSFQVTAQELSTIVRHGFTPIILLLNNSGYTIERAILGKTSAYNDVARWSYHELPRVFGIAPDDYFSAVATTPAELDSALHAAATEDRLVFIEVKIEPLDIPPATAAVGEFTRQYDYGTYGPANK